MSELPRGNTEVVALQAAVGIEFDLQVGIVRVKRPQSMIEEVERLNLERDPLAFRDIEILRQ